MVNKFLQREQMYAVLRNEVNENEQKYERLKQENEAKSEKLHQLKIELDNSKKDMLDRPDLSTEIESEE